MRDALAEFKAAVQRIRDIADDITLSAPAALKDGALRLRHQTIQCAVTVSLSGYFESYLKATAEAFIVALSGKNIPFVDLPLRIKFTHFSVGGAFISRLAREERKDLRSSLAGATSSGIQMPLTEDASRRLASATHTVPYQLLWEAFAETHANPGPETVTQYLGAFDIEQGWAKMCAAIVALPSAATHGMTATTVRVLLSNFIDVRNECAHTGSAVHIPSPSEIRGYCELLDFIAEGVTKVLEDRIALF